MVIIFLLIWLLHLENVVFPCHHILQLHEAILSKPRRILRIKTRREIVINRRRPWVRHIRLPFERLMVLVAFREYLKVMLDKVTVKLTAKSLLARLFVPTPRTQIKQLCSLSDPVILCPQNPLYCTLKAYDLLCHIPKTHRFLVPHSQSPSTHWAMPSEPMSPLYFVLILYSRVWFLMCYWSGAVVSKSMADMHWA